MNAEITANRARFSALEFSSSTLRVYYLPLRTISAAVAHFLDMEGVTGSIPVSSTIDDVALTKYECLLLRLISSYV